ncbi:amidohydrolase [Actinoplanes bogorensis]|uniref:Amidohydrolase n=1 Tax=Paractinoplanes bogorensis TaxID=1610840 RepID=A0ABS5YXA2_9ACTN|nr:amidohydrolase [Actinoplanes bogorensis]MBU2668075.1 amidohydrolase [Actinoplanes bogorensis]
MSVTRIFHHGVVHTLDAQSRVHSALAVDGERVLAVGSDDEILALATESTELVDLAGGVVFPGFIDAHTHLEVAASVRRLWINAALETPERVLEIVAEEVAQRPAGTWIVIAGGFLSPLPTLATLDEIAPEHPVVIRRTMHVQVANSRAFELSGLSPDDPQPLPGSRIELDADGSFTGMVEDCFDLFAVRAPDDATLGAAIQATATEFFLANGITTIHDMPASPQGTRMLQQMHRDHALPVRVVLYPILPPVHSSGPDLEAYESVGFQTGFGDDWLRFGGVKLFVDGHERGAARSEEMAADVTRHRQPLFGRTYEQLVATVIRAMRSRIQLRMHAWGDYAQRQAIDAVRVAARATGRDDHRTRVEHMLNAGYSSIGVDEVRDAGIVPVPQASFLINDDPSDSVEKYPFRRAIDAGLTFANSSDCTGSQPTLVSPWVGIAAMLDRTNRNGKVIDAGQRVTLDEALRSYTHGSAWAAFEEGDKGSLEPGKLADFAVVEADPYDLDPAGIARLRTTMTVIGGEIRYTAGG